MKSEPYNKSPGMKYSKAFYNLRMHSAYMKAVYNSNKVNNFIDILKSEKFKIIDPTSEPRKKPKEIKQNIDTIARDALHVEFHEFLDSRKRWRW